MTWRTPPVAGRSRSCTQPSRRRSTRPRSTTGSGSGRHPDYLRTRPALNDCVDVVSIQHEYGIWGGEDGEHVIDFVRALRVPVVATLHTVLRDPTPNQRAVLRELVSIAEASVVMSSSAADLLSKAYGVDPRRVRIIPHGVPNVSLVDPRPSSPRWASPVGT